MLLRWSWILLLSVSGLAMGLLSLFGLTRGLEGLLWLLIWVGCAFVLAFKVPGKAFLHGMATGVIAAAVHSLLLYFFFDTYTTWNPHILEGAGTLPGGADVRNFQLLLTPLVAIFSGIFLGLLTLMVWKIRSAVRARRQERAG